MDSGAVHVSIMSIAYVTEKREGWGGVFLGGGVHGGGGEEEGGLVPRGSVCRRGPPLPYQETTNQPTNIVSMMLSFMLWYSPVE